jgi:predicted HTH domain antitoxin
MNERLPIEIETALNEYRNEKVSFGKASEIAGVNLWRFIDICHQNNIPLKFSKEDAEIGIEFVKEFDFDEYKTRMDKKLKNTD